MFDERTPFYPFFDERVSVRGSRGGRAFAATVRACVIDAGLADADADAVADTVEHTYSVRVYRTEWPTPDGPRRGDSVELPSGVKLKIASVELDSIWYDATAITKGGAK